jgi:hypothetical protein
MWKFLGVVTTSILLGMVSPWLAAADGGPVLRTWFQWLPVQVDLLLLPDGELMMLVLAMAVLAAQYLLMFLLVMPLWPLLRRARTFITVPVRRRFSSH